MRRRLLLFLAIFGTGLALLYWLEGRGSPEDRQARTEPVPTTRTVEDDFIEVPVQIGEGESEHGVEGSLSGKTSIGIFTETKPSVLHVRIEAEDSELQGDSVYELLGVTVRRLDPGTRKLELSIDAESARAQIDTTSDVPIDPDYPILLRGVTAQLLRDVVFAPISLRTDELRGVLADNTLFTDADVVVTGRGLRAIGTGLRIDPETRTLTLASDADLEVRRPGGSTATLSSTGPLEARTREEQGAFAVRAETEARIEIRSAGEARERDAVLSGNEIEILGHTESAGDEPFRIERVTAIENAVIRTADGEFSAARATVRFDAAGIALSALLVGEPQVRIDLRNLSDEGEPVRVELSGVGPLTLDLSPERRGSFELEGASQLHVPSFDATLSAERRMRGVRTQAGRTGKLIAVGGVVGELETGTLTTDEIEFAAVSAQEGEVALLLQSSGPTRSVGTLPDGRAYELEATRGLSYRRVGDAFQVPEARGFSFRVEGAEAFETSAGVLLDFDGETLAFRADEDVSFSSELGRGSGTSLIALGRDSGVLTGEPGRPARFDYADGWLEAQTIDFEPGNLRAEGDAAGAWSTQNVATTLDAPWIELEDVEGERVLTAGGGIDAVVRTEERTLSVEARELELRATLLPDVLKGEDRLGPIALTARDEVIVDYLGEVEFAGRGGLLEVAVEGPASGTGRLLPAEGQRLTSRGRLPGKRVSFELLSDTLEFGEQSLVARNAVLDVDGITVGLTSSEAREPGSVRAISGRLEANADAVLFEESVYIGRFGERGEVWSLDADRALLTAGAPVEGELPVLSRLEAWEGFSLRFDRGMEANGERLEVDREDRKVRMTGNPVQVQVPGANWTAKEFEIDPEIGSVRASAGSLRLVTPSGVSPWTLSYESIEPRIDRDETIQVVRRPIFVDGLRVMRADWAVFWIDPQGFRALTTGSGSSEDFPTVAPPEGAGSTGPPEAPRMPSLFGSLNRDGETAWLRELYLDGNLEMLESGLRMARAGAVYLDFIDGHGWLYDADFTIRSPGRVVRLHADWLRHSADGSLRADSAVLTSCDFDVPHYTVESGSLDIEPRTDPEGEKTSWFVELRDNAIRFADGPALPLPKIGFAMNKDYSVDADQISVFGARPFSIGNSARFGTFVETSVASDMSGLARRFHQFLRKLIPRGSLNLPDLPGGPSFGDLGLGPPPKGELSASAAYLGSRGALLDLGLEIESQDFYRFKIDSAVVFDSGRDRGLIRVPENDRDEVRWWIRERGRIQLGEDSWIDAVFTTQSDPGVQSEFFEGDYLRYEDRETFLNWRRADGEDYANVTVEARPDDWRTEVLEQPNGRLYLGRREVTTWGETPVYYDSNSTVGYMRRIEGDPFYEAGFADGFGDGESLRADTRHRLEAPASLGVWGLRATPYIEGVGTVWSESATGNSSPARAGLLAGLELTSTIWKPLGDDGLHELTGSIGVRTDLASEESGGIPYTFDQIETSIEGSFVDMKLRSLLSTPGAEHRWDLELALTHAQGSPDVPNGFRPLQVKTDYVSSFRDTLFGVYHDGRYDLEGAGPVYMRTIFGIEPYPAVAFGFGHSQGRNSMDQRIYEALTLAARWQVNPKYELIGTQSVSLIDSGSLASQAVVRRYGHDFVFDIEVSFRQGEGSSFSIGVEPLQLFDRPRFAFVERLRYAQQDG